MNLPKLSLVLLGSLGLFFLGACGSGNQPSNSTNSPANSTSTPASEPDSSNSKTSTTETIQYDHPSKSQGGQVVESGAYHLELVTEPEENGTHLDLYLQRGDNHETIPNAQVTAQIQSPDGTQKSLDFKYDAEGKHYTVLLPEKNTGQYQVKVTSDINGEKADGRFSFNR